MKNGKLYPIEIKKNSNPRKFAGRHFSVLKKTGKEFGIGCIIYMTEDLVPLDRDKWLVPVWMV